jgi:periplasmic divalent cation tolerance protein
MTDKIVVLSSCGAEEEAARVAKHLLEKKLAACVSVLPGARSLYWWQGAIEDSTEWLLVIKSTRACFARLSEELRSVHSYKVPEILALPVVDGSQDYLEWMDREIDLPSGAKA